MTKKIAAGIIIFRRENQSSPIEYLLLKSSKFGNWTPPKGHLEWNETELQTAIRETEEESGLKNNSDYEIIDLNYTIQISYPVNGREKISFYWCAKLNDEKNPEVILSYEHLEYKWLGFEEAVQIVEYEPMRNALVQANERINKFLIK